MPVRFHQSVSPGLSVQKCTVQECLYKNVLCDIGGTTFFFNTGITVECAVMSGLLRLWSVFYASKNKCMEQFMLCRSVIACSNWALSTYLASWLWNCSTCAFALAVFFSDLYVTERVNLQLDGHNFSWIKLLSASGYWFSSAFSTSKYMSLPCQYLFFYKTQNISCVCFSEPTTQASRALCS